MVILDDNKAGTMGSSLDITIHLSLSELLATSDQVPCYVFNACLMLAISQSITERIPPKRKKLLSSAVQHNFL
jgi:hypothetical protein